MCKLYIKPILYKVEYDSIVCVYQTTVSCKFFQSMVSALYQKWLTCKDKERQIVEDHIARCLQVLHIWLGYKNGLLLRNTDKVGQVMNYTYLT